MAIFVLQSLSENYIIWQQCWRFFILGLVQGLTEFLPISSTAHLKVVSILLGWGDPGIFVSASIQIGSIIALLIYFREDLIKIINSLSQFKYLIKSRQSEFSNITSAIFIGSLPIIFIGLILKLYFYNSFEQSFLRSLNSIGVVSILMSFVFYIAEKYGNMKMDINQISRRHGFLIGLAQSLAIIPGVSRSGATLSASMLCGFDRVSAARFSFLLGIPAISMAGIVELISASKDLLYIDYLPLFIGIVSSAITSFWSIDFLLKFLSTNNTRIFILYRLMFGIVLISYSLH